MKTKREKLVEFAKQKAKEDVGFWDKIKAGGRMLQAHFKGNFKIGKRALFLAPVSLIYLVVPFDFDWIPFLGWLDDLTILTFAFSSLMKEITRYLEWERGTHRSPNQNITIVDAKIVD